MQSDPIGLAGGINTYGYGRAEPTKRIDPLGLADFAFGVEVDLTALFPGVEYGFGVVYDSDSVFDSGWFLSLGVSAGANVGFGVGGMYTSGDIEGSSVGVDVNGKIVSGQFGYSLDDCSRYYGASVGPGIGGSLNRSETRTLSLDNLGVGDVYRWTIRTFGF